MPVRSAGHRTRESRAEHSRKLIQAAYDLIPQVGIGGLRTREIAQRAGVHLATFHYCFESKDALLAALYGDIIERLRVAIDDIISISDPPSKRLAAHRRLRQYLLVDNRHLLVV